MSSLKKSSNSCRLKVSWEKKLDERSRVGVGYDVLRREVLMEEENKILTKIGRAEEIDH